MIFFSHKYHGKRKYRNSHQDNQLVDHILKFFDQYDEKEYTLVELGRSTNIELKILSK